MTTPNPISVRGLARSFKTRDGIVEAVKGIDFEVRPGEIVGLLGPNGAGKTTTLRMLTTLLEPSAGSATVATFDLATQAKQVRGRIGYVAQVGSMPAAGTVVGEELIAQARLQGMSKADAALRLTELAPRLNLDGLERRSLMELSGGQRRRFDVALGLMHAPAVVFLDEPTTGLDPQSRANLWEHIRALRDDMGVTILLTTHYLEEADALSDRILVMDDGVLVADDTPAALKAKVAGDVVRLGFASDGDRERAAAAIVGAVDVRDSVADGTELAITVDSAAVATAPLLSSLQQAGLQPTTVAIDRPSLDDVFLTLTGHSLREDES